MNKFMRAGLMLALVLAMAISAGCAKQSTVETPPADPYGGTQMTAEEQAAANYISNAKVYFAFDRFDLAQDSKNVLRDKAEKMKQFPQLRVIIEGHCDERGTEEYNLALGERRARAAYEYLLMLGVSANQMEMLSYGKLHPAVDGHGEQAWAQNRRDEFKVTKPR